MDVILVLFLLGFLYRSQRSIWIGRLKEINRFHNSRIDSGYIDLLTLIHFILFLIYFVYAQFFGSDSFVYHAKSAITDNWFDLWGSDTRFVNFITWPFSHLLGLGYFATMLVFFYVGLQGVMLFYFAARENIRFVKPMYRSFSIVELIFLLPNMHFWSNSIGKGSVMLLGIGLIIYGISRFKTRILLIILGGFLVFMIRAHIMFVILLGIGSALVLTQKGIKKRYRFPLLLLAAVIGYYISSYLTRFTGRNDLNIFDSAGLQRRALEMSRSAGSGVDIGNYNQAQKLLTLWYRPLFFDAPGFLGLIVSIENLLYIFFTIQIIRFGFPNWGKWNGWFRISLFIFLFGSLALSQIAANLGIAMRQKAQIMPCFFIVYCKTIEIKNIKRLRLANQA